VVTFTLHRPGKLKAMNRAAQYSAEKGARMGVVSRLILLATCLALSWLPAWARDGLLTAPTGALVFLWHEANPSADHPQQSAITAQRTHVTRVLPRLVCIVPAGTYATVLRQESQVLAVTAFPLHGSDCEGVTDAAAMVPVARAFQAKVPALRSPLMSSVQPPASPEAVEDLCQMVGDVAETMAQSRDRGLSLPQTLALIRQGLEPAAAPTALVQITRTMLLYIYRHPRWTPGIARQRLTGQCAQEMQDE
jgi:hypothetical protein